MRREAPDHKRSPAPEPGRFPLWPIGRCRPWTVHVTLFGMTQPDPNQPPVVPGSPAPALPAGPFPPAQQAPPLSPAPYGYGYPQPMLVVKPPPSGTAIASLIFGIMGILGGWCLAGIPCVIAVLCGHAGLADTRNNAKSGRGMAIAGLIMGYLSVIPAVLFFVTFGVGLLFQ